MAWTDAQHADPSAGVTLYKVIVCPRCGIEKGKAKSVKKGLCVDCAGVLRIDGTHRLWLDRAA